MFRLQNKIEGKLNYIESAVAILEVIFASFLTKAVRMFTSKEISDNKKILHDIKEIEEFKY